MVVVGSFHVRAVDERGAGPDEDNVVREIHGEWKGWKYPRADQILGVRIDVIPATKPNTAF